MDPEDMMAKRGRLYLVTFDEADETGPLPMKADLKWVWGVLLAILVGVVYLLLR